MPASSSKATTATPSMPQPRLPSAGEAVQGLTRRLTGTGSRFDLGAVYFGPTVLQALVGPRRASSRSRPRPRRGRSPATDLGAVGHRLQGCGGPHGPVAVGPDPTAPRSALPLPGGQGGRPPGREDRSLASATPSGRRGHVTDPPDRAKVWTLALRPPFVSDLEQAGYRHRRTPTRASARQYSRRPGRHPARRLPAHCRRSRAEVERASKAANALRLSAAVSASCFAYRPTMAAIGCRMKWVDRNGRPPRRRRPTVCHRYRYEVNGIRFAPRIVPVLWARATGRGCFWDRGYGERRSSLLGALRFACGHRSPLASGAVLHLLPCSSTPTRRRSGQTAWCC